MNSRPKTAEEACNAYGDLYDYGDASDLAEAVTEALKDRDYHGNDTFLVDVLHLMIAEYWRVNS